MVPKFIKQLIVIWWGLIDNWLSTEMKLSPIWDVGHIVAVSFCFKKGRKKRGFCLICNCAAFVNITPVGTGTRIRLYLNIQMKIIRWSGGCFGKWLFHRWHWIRDCCEPLLISAGYSTTQYSLSQSLTRRPREWFLNVLVMNRYSSYSWFRPVTAQLNFAWVSL